MMCVCFHRNSAYSCVCRVAHFCMMGGSSPALRVCTLMLLRMRVMPSSSYVNIFLLRLLRPDWGGCEPEPRPCFVSIKVGFFPGVMFERLPGAGGCTFRFYVEKNGWSCLRSTRTRVTLSSLGSSSIGVSFRRSTFRCRSFSGCRMFGV